MKKTISRSIEKIVDDQVRQWQKIDSMKEPKGISIITISREYGAGGIVIAEQLAKKLGYSLFHQEIIEQIANSAKISKQIVKTLDEKKRSLLEESISAVIHERHLWPDEFMKHLMNVIGTIGRHGRAIIVGRGGSVILPLEKILRIRIISPLPQRIKNISKVLNIPETEARKLILKTDADRKSFIRKYFYIEVADPFNYDVVINTGRISFDTAVESIIAGLKNFELISQR